MLNQTIIALNFYHITIKFLILAFFWENIFIDFTFNNNTISIAVIKNNKNIIPINIYY